MTILIACVVVVSVSFVSEGWVLVVIAWLFCPLIMENPVDDIVRRKSHHDPGWNDPPLYSYDALNPPTGSKKSNILNKRVAYPLGTEFGSSPPSGGMNPTLPPSSKTTALPPTGFISSFSGNRSRCSSESGNSQETALDKKETLLKVTANFDDVLKRSLSLSLPERNEIRKRLGIMEKMWEEDKLNTSVHKRLLELSHELKLGNFEAADHIHVGLMVDHAAVCSPWMVAVRKLVQHLKTATPPPPSVINPMPVLSDMDAQTCENTNS